MTQNCFFKLLEIVMQLFKTLANHSYIFWGAQMYWCSYYECIRHLMLTWCLLLCTGPIGEINTQVEELQENPISLN